MEEEQATRDRRARLIIYALLVVLVALGLLFPTIIKNTPSTEAMEAYQLVDSVSGGGLVFLATDSVSGGDGQRQLAALIRQVVSSGAVLVTASTSDAGAAEVDRVLRSQLSSLRRTYGQAAINLGCRTGGMGYLENLEAGFSAAAQGRDHGGEDLEMLQLTHSFRRLDDADLFIFITGGTMAAVRSAQSIAYSSAVQVMLAVSGEEAISTATQLWQEGRVDAILAGNKTTGDYESLVAGGGTPARYLTALTLGTLFVMLLIVWAYLGGFINRRRRA